MASLTVGGSERPVCGPCRRVVLATVVGGEQRPKPTGGAWAQELEDPSTRLVYLIRPALEGMRHATAALFGPDNPVADDIGAAYEALFTLNCELEDHAAVHLAARARSAVAGLAETVATVYINAEAERMGQLAREVADIARTRRAWASVPAPVLGVLRELSEVCLDMAVKAAIVVESHGKIGVAEADRGHEADRLAQSLFQQLLSRPDGIDVYAAIDLTLAARAYERYAEHAVAVAHRAALLAVGAPRS
jgi:phosphate transport system protein